MTSIESRRQRFKKYEQKLKLRGWKQIAFRIPADVWDEYRTFHKERMTKWKLEHPKPRIDFVDGQWVVEEANNN